jgi:hypothetical protein
MRLLAAVPPIVPAPPFIYVPDVPAAAVAGGHDWLLIALAIGFGAAVIVFAYFAAVVFLEDRIDKPRRRGGRGD